MRRLFAVPNTADVTILAAQTASAITDFLVAGTDFGLVPASWGNDSADNGSVSQFDLELWAAGSNTITSAVLYALTRHTGTVAADDVNAVVNATEKLTVTGHAYLTGDGPFQLTTTTTLPAGYALATDYWIVVFDANTIGLASSFANALAGTLVAITSDGTGTHTITAASGCQLMRWSVLSAIGTVTLTLRQGYINRFNHNSGNYGYALGGTFGSAVATSAVLRSVVER